MHGQLESTLYLTANSYFKGVNYLVSVCVQENTNLL